MGALQAKKSWGGSVAGEEVLGTGSEGDDLQVLQADDRAGDREELNDFVSQLFSVADGIFRDIALQVAHAQVVGAVQHSAVGVAAAVDHVAVAFRRGHEHHGAVEVLRHQGFRRFRTEVSEEHAGSVALVGLQLFNSLQHIIFIFHRGLDLHEIDLFVSQLRGDGGTALLAQRDGETVAGNGDQTEFNDRDVFHVNIPPPKNIIVRTCL